MNRGGPGKCAACNHADHDKIDQALIAQTPLTKLAKRYGMSIMALSRHRTGHLSGALVGVKKGKTEDNFLGRMESMMERTDAILTLAERTKKGAQALSAIDTYGRLAEKWGKARGELDERPTTVINIAASQEWIAVRSAMMAALVPFPEALRAVDDALAGLG